MKNLGSPGAQENKKDICKKTIVLIPRASGNSGWRRRDV